MSTRERLQRDRATPEMTWDGSTSLARGQHGLFEPILQWVPRYCNPSSSLYYNLVSKSQITCNRQIQNSLARAVVKAPKSCHMTPILRSLHSLKTTERIEYKLLSLTHNVFTTTHPPCLHKLHLCSTSQQYSLFISRHSHSASNIVLVM